MNETRLAAIMFTDIAGYSRLMEEDEQRTIQLLKEHNGIVLPIISSFGGRVVDAIGDGLFVVLDSVFDAVQCAGEIHAAVSRHNDDAASGMRFHLRIGIHLGDVWHEGGRVFGNGVNVAARIQPQAVPGGICISEDVYRQIANKISQPTVHIGTPRLRNISRSVPLYRIVTGFEANIEEPGEGFRGTLDQVKQEIIREKEKFAEEWKAGRGKAGHGKAGHGKAGHGAGTPGYGDAGSRFEEAIQSKVYGLVERVMDSALSSWEKMPAEKKDRAAEHVRVKLGKGPGVRLEELDEENDRVLTGDLGFGILAAAGTGVGYFVFGISWMIWPLLILGVLPTLSGLGKMYRGLVRRYRIRRRRPLELEQRILKAARNLGHRVTVVQVAEEADLPLDEVQRTLDDMTRKGFVSQDVLDSGVVQYEFPVLQERATPRPPEA